jgi:hypothetical protein
MVVGGQTGGEVTAPPPLENRPGGSIRSFEDLEIFDAPWRYSAQRERQIWPTPTTDHHHQYPTEGEADAADRYDRPRPLPYL